MKDNKAKITISISPDLLRRIDAVAEAREMKRSTLMERMLGNQIEEQEEFLLGMEKPLDRAVARVLLRNPKVMKAMSVVVGEHISDEQIERAKRELPNELARGKNREAVKKAREKAKRARAESDGEVAFS